MSQLVKKILMTGRYFILRHFTSKVLRGILLNTHYDLIVMKRINKPVERRDHKKRKYHAPVLKKYGTVASLTLGAGSDVHDMGGLSGVDPGTGGGGT